MSWPRAALLSLSDKREAAAFAKALAAHGARLLASGGTAKHLAEQGVEVTPVEEWTGFPELLGGRVKTLHPHVHAPILARRGEPGDLAALAERGLEPIDLVAVTLYPFEERAAKLDEADAVEEIDIGGVALLRAAAKNFADVIVVHDPSQYAEVLAALEADRVDTGSRRRWALAAFARTARYDAAIAAELARRTGASTAGAPGDAATAGAPPVFVLALERARPLRYGENPHQSAALYARLGGGAALEAWREGKELSYNNLLDLEAAVTLAGRFAVPACVIVKHGEPCGVAAARTTAEAWAQALAADELSAFGGIVAFNRALDAETATALAKQYVECVAASDFEPAAADALKSKKNLRLVRLTSSDLRSPEPWGVRLLGPWALLQSDAGAEEPEWRIVTRTPPTPDQIVSMQFAWEVAARARSNAVVIARGTTLVGLGSGQTSRVDAVSVAIMKARRAGHALSGTVLASDGFFPFPDGVTLAAEAGIAAIVQPGGSVKDAEVIAEADRLGCAMVFTGRRVFRH